MKRLIKPFLDLSVFMFPVTLILYLVLFLFEIVFPGFVSNISNLNYFLFPLLFFGVLATFSEKIKLHSDYPKKPTKWDLILITILTTICFLILVYKTRYLEWTGLVVSISSTLLIIFISIVIFVFPYLEKSTVEQPESSTKKSIIICLVYLILVIIISGLVFNLYRKKISSKNKTTTIENNVLNVRQQSKFEFLDKQLLQKIPILIENGSKNATKTASIATFLRNFNFNNIKIENADNFDYKNAYILFNAEDSKVASYLTLLLTDNNKFKIVNMLPPIRASQSGIILIIGE